jgi:hypothetical protein
MGDLLSKEEIDSMLSPSTAPEPEISTEAQALGVLEKSYWELKNVPKHLRTAKVCFEAVKRTSWELCHVPEELKTAELCMEAVKKSGSILEYVPEALRTAELCLEAVKQNDWYRGSRNQPFQYVPEALKTPELYMEAVKKNGWALEYIPEAFKTSELCLEAVKQDGTALEFVPETLKTAELCMVAVKSHGFALKYVPEVLKTAEICSEAFKNCHASYEYIPEIFIAREQSKQPYRSDFERAVAEIFEKEFRRIYYRLSFFLETGRREGLLALGNYLDKEKIAVENLLETSIMMCVDAIGEGAIKEYIDSWINANCAGPLEYYERILASVIKTGALAIWAGENPIIAKARMMSKIPINLIPNLRYIDEKDYFSRVKSKQ